jgi:hypothetical protein
VGIAEDRRETGVTPSPAEDGGDAGVDVWPGTVSARETEGASTPVVVWAGGSTRLGGSGKSQGRGTIAAGMILRTRVRGSHHAWEIS